MLSSESTHGTHNEVNDGVKDNGGRCSALKSSGWSSGPKAPSARLPAQTLSAPSSRWSSTARDNIPRDAMRDRSAIGRSSSNANSLSQLISSTSPRAPDPDQKSEARPTATMLAMPSRCRCRRNWRSILGPRVMGGMLEGEVDGRDLVTAVVRGKVRGCRSLAEVDLASARPRESKVALRQRRERRF